jgi:hypothetical protein
MNKPAKFLAGVFYGLIALAILFLPLFAIRHHPLWWIAWAAVLGVGFWVVAVDHRRDEARRTVGMAIAEARLAAWEGVEAAKLADIPLQRTTTQQPGDF